MRTDIRATFYLLFITFLWAATYPVVKNVVNYIQPSLLVASRFLVAFITMLPFVIDALKKEKRNILLPGIVLGLLNSGIYISQAIGLKGLASTHSAFLIGTNVILVVFLAPLFRLGKLTLIDITSGILCAIGFYIFTGFAINLKVSNIWCFATSLLTALSILYLQYSITKKAIISLQLLVFYQIFFTIPIPALLAIKDLEAHALMQPMVIISILFCAILSTNIAFTLQTKYQAFLSPTKVALIFALEPIFTAILEILTKREIMSIHMVAGGLVMFFSIILNTMVRSREENTNKKNEHLLLSAHFINRL